MDRTTVAEERGRFEERNRVFFEIGNERICHVELVVFAISQDEKSSEDGHDKAEDDDDG